MLAAAILSAAACSPIDDPCNNPGTRQGELSISVSMEEPTRAMITDSMLPDGSEMGIALFDAGHFGTEDIIVDVLAENLKKNFKTY